MNRLTGSLFRGTACLLVAVASSVACSSSDAKKNDDCTPDDADGIVDEPMSLLLTVNDSEFLPKILATQNTSEITLTLENKGTAPHGFVIDCLPTPNDDGCPTESCFPSEAKIDSVEPGEKTTVVFESPLVEGIYQFRSAVPEDTALAPGQFIIQ